MITEFRLPDLGEGLPEAELVQWLVAEGDAVTLNQTIAEVETAKAVVELPSPYAGTIAKLHAEAGDTVEVGSALIDFDVVGADAEAATPRAASASDARTEQPETSETSEKTVANLVGYGAAPRAAGRPQRRARSFTAAVDNGVDAAVLEAAPHDALHGHTDLTDAPVERPRSTPPVRKLAKELGVELALVEGTGANGLITRADVQEYAERVGTAPRTPAPQPTPATPWDRPERVTRTPIRGVRKATAEAMVRSATTAPHATVFLTVDVTPAMELVASLKADRSLGEHRIGILAIAAKAACLALSRTPDLNARWDDEAGEIVWHHYVDLGIAAATPRGLVVPVVRDAGALTLIELAEAIRALAEAARAGKTSPADMMGSTFSITNVGVFGVDAGTPILNPGEAGILAVGAVRRRPWEHRGDIALREVMTLSLSFDHRLVDGEQASRFLTDVGGVLAEPGRAMLLR